MGERSCEAPAREGEAWNRHLAFSPPAPTCARASHREPKPSSKYIQGWREDQVCFRATERRGGDRKWMEEEGYDLKLKQEALLKVKGVQDSGDFGGKKEPHSWN